MVAEVTASGSCAPATALADHTLQQVAEHPPSPHQLLLFETRCHWGPLDQHSRCSTAPPPVLPTGGSQTRSGEDHARSAQTAARRGIKLVHAGGPCRLAGAGPETHAQAPR